MKQYRALLVGAVAVGLLIVGASAVEAAKAKKGAGVSGVVEEVTKDSIKVKVTGKKGAETSETKTFTLNSTTKYEKAAGKKAGGSPTAATADDVKVGSHVTISASGSTADKVTIVAGKKKNK
jgi:hypothetical protein